MATCLDFAVRHRPTSLHLCFEVDPEAAKALKGFARDIESACEDEVIFIFGASGGRKRCVGFLKRDFVSVEQYSIDDDDDDDDEEEEEDGSDIPGPGNAESGNPRGPFGGRAVDAATMILKAATKEGAEK